MNSRVSGQCSYTILPDLVMKTCSKLSELKLTKCISVHLFRISFVLILCMLVWLLQVITWSKDINFQPPIPGLQQCEYSNTRNQSKFTMLSVSSEDSRLTIFTPSEEDDFTSKSQCVPLMCLRKSSPICVYDPKTTDIYVSKDIVKTGCYERPTVRAFIEVMETDSTFVLLDLGCNIGAFTITAAAHGFTVVGMDPVQRNLQLLTKSLCLGRLQQNVTLLWNAVSDIRGTAYYKVNKGNVGGTNVRISNQKSREIDMDHTAEAILLNDLMEFKVFDSRPVFIKMDIEGSEYRALFGGKRFLSAVDVRYLLMEWRFYRTKTWAKSLIPFLEKLHFEPYSGDDFRKRLNPRVSATWPDNVLWKRIRLTRV